MVQMTMAAVMVTLSSAVMVMALLVLAVKVMLRLGVTTAVRMMTAVTTTNMRRRVTMAVTAVTFVGRDPDDPQ